MRKDPSRGVLTPTPPLVLQHVLWVLAFLSPSASPSDSGCAPLPENQREDRRLAGVVPTALCWFFSSVHIILDEELWMSCLFFQGFCVNLSYSVLNATIVLLLGGGPYHTPWSLHLFPACETTQLKGEQTAALATDIQLAAVARIQTAQTQYYYPCVVADDAGGVVANFRFLLFLIFLFLCCVSVCVCSPNSEVSVSP